MAWGKKHLPQGVQNYSEFLKKDIKTLIGGYFLAQFKIMFVVAVILAVGLMVLRVKHGILFAVLIAFLDFLPVFGTGTCVVSMGCNQVIFRAMDLCCGAGGDLCADPGSETGDTA